MYMTGCLTASNSRWMISAKYLADVSSNNIHPSAKYLYLFSRLGNVVRGRYLSELIRSEWGQSHGLKGNFALFSYQ